MGSVPAFTVFLAEPGTFLLRLYEYVHGGGELEARMEPDGRTLVHEAFDRLDVEALIYLTDGGASLDVSRDGDFYLLHEAIDHDLDTMIQNGLPLVLPWTRVLLWLGADACVRTRDGRSARDLCAERGVEAVRLFEREIERRPRH
jgi:hypothetical protein